MSVTSPKFFKKDNVNLTLAPIESIIKCKGRNSLIIIGLEYSFTFLSSTLMGPRCYSHDQDVTIQWKVT